AGQPSVLIKEGRRAPGGQSTIAQTTSGPGIKNVVSIGINKIGAQTQSLMGDHSIDPTKEFGSCRLIVQKTNGLVQAIGQGGLGFIRVPLGVHIFLVHSGPSIQIKRLKVLSFLSPK